MLGFEEDELAFVSTTGSTVAGVDGLANKWYSAKGINMCPEGLSSACTVLASLGGVNVGLSSVRKWTCFVAQSMTARSAVNDSKPNNAGTLELGMTGAV